jgi:glucose/arabinose dehydrogenase
MTSRSASGTSFLTFVLGWLGPLALLIAAEPNWPVLDFQPVATGLNQVVDIQNAGDLSNRLFLVEQGGRIRILKNGSLLPAPLLDVSGKVAPYSEQGLLGLAFPPGFAQKKCFYVFYCRVNDGAAVVSRFRISPDPDVANPASEEILLVTQKSQTNHNGGQLAFGPDGLLYISIGDGGGAGDPERNSQNLRNRLGKILRINVEATSPGLPYAIPASNPFATSATNSREILCWGLRNPWRFSFDPLNGDLFIGDVGENQREEINYVPFSSIASGINFGWSVKEGTLDFVAQTGTVGTLRPPAFEYPRPLGYSITGGHIYRGPNPRLYGFYLFGDFQTNRIWAMESPAAGGRVELIKDTYHSFSTFGKDEAGEIYFADYGNHSVYRIDALDTLPSPQISGGTSFPNTFFTIKANATGAVIHYTLDGSIPTLESPVFSDNTTLSQPYPVRIRAALFRADMPTSPVVEARYDLKLPAVQIGRPEDTSYYVYYYDDNNTVPLTHPIPGTEIHYTLDGSQPTRSSPLYSAETGIAAKRSFDIKAIALHPAEGWLPSDVSAKSYYVSVYTPKLTVSLTGLYDPVHVTSQTPGAILHYTTDGSTPTLQSAVWTTPRDLPAGTVIRVLAEKRMMSTSIAYLTVAKFSSQATRFEKLATGNLTNVRDVVRTNAATFHAVCSSGEVWTRSGGAWSLFSAAPSGSHDFTSVVTPPGGKLTLADAGAQGLLQFLPPSNVPDAPWTTTPLRPQDLAPLPAGGLLAADYVANRIYEISPSRAITLIAGNGTTTGADGPALAASLTRPIALTRDSQGRVFIVEGAAGISGRRIRMLGTDNNITTLTPNSTLGWTDGLLADARFEQPRAIVCDRIGNLYVADGNFTAGGLIRKVRPDGTVTTLHGPVYQTATTTILTPDSFGPSVPKGLDVDENGVLYIAGDNTVTKATQEDWDNDGIPDTTEAALGTPFVVGIDDRLADSDGDLFSNCGEWIAGTNPHLSASLPIGTTLIKLPDGTVSLNFPCEPGKTCQLEYTDDLQNWKSMGAPFTSVLRSFSACFTASPLISQRFYRLRSTP